MSIAAVFCIGCAKLWYNNRLMRKQEILDEEKRARVSDMRKAGVPASAQRGVDIPFGVRAIQGGIEVDGVWISRQATPDGETKPRLQSTANLIDTGADPNKKGKMADDLRSTTEQRGSQSDMSPFQQPAKAESFASTQSGPARQSELTGREPRHPRPVNVLNEDTLRRLDSYSPPRTTFETYIPARSARRPSQRSSDSCSGDSTDSRPRSGVSGGSGSGRSHTSSRAVRVYTSGPRLDSRPSRASIPWGLPEKDRSDHYESSGSGTPISQATYGGIHSPSLPDQELPAPEPTFGPGGSHVNKASRRVNQDFELLPAGTFGTRHELGANSMAVRHIIPAPDR